MRLRQILTVDCGAAHVACGLFSRAADGGLVLERLATETLPPREPSDEEWAAAVAASLKVLSRQVQYRGPCVLGLPGHLTFAKLIRTPDVSARQRQKIIRFEARQGVPSALDDVIWTDASVARSENGRDVALTAARLSMIEALCARLCAAGFYPLAVLPPWFVLRHGACHQRHEAGQALVLSIGARSTHLVYCGAARFFMRTFALGGNAVTQRIAEELGMEFARAESLKRQVLGGTAELSADSPEHMAVQIAADEFVRRVGGEMSRSLASFCPEDGGNRPGILHLVGSGARIPELPVGLGERLQMRVEHWEALRHVRLGAAIVESSGASETAPLSDLIGLAEGATSREAAEVNLLPRALRWEMRIRRWWPWMAATALLFIAGLAVAVWRERTQATEIRGKAAEGEARINDLRRLDERNRGNLARLAQANRRIAALQRLIEARSGWVTFFADLQERLVKTEDVWLESLQILPPGKPATSPASAPGNSRLGSIAPGDHATRLGRDPVVRLALAGYLFDAGKPLAAAGEGSCEQARCLLAQLRASPYVAAIEAERFDSSRPNLLRFEITLVLAPQTLF